MRNAESLSQEQIREFLRSRPQVTFCGLMDGKRNMHGRSASGTRNHGELDRPEPGAVRPLCRKGHGDEHGVNEALDPRLFGLRNRAGGTVPAASNSQSGRPNRT